MSVSTTALGVSIYATSIAHQAKITACMGYVSAFNAQTATVADSKAYAECIGLLHPNPMSAEEVVGLKLLFVAGLAGAAIGASKGLWIGTYVAPVDRVFGFLLGGMLAPLGLVGMGALVMGILWVLK